jgi:hypothetical protein
MSQRLSGTDQLSSPGRTITSYKNKKVCFLSCMLMLISLFSCEKGSIFMPGLTECKIGYVLVCQNMRNTKIAGN